MSKSTAYRTEWAASLGKLGRQLSDSKSACHPISDGLISKLHGSPRRKGLARSHLGGSYSHLVGKGYDTHNVMRNRSDTAAILHRVKLTHWTRIRSGNCNRKWKPTVCTLNSAYNEVAFNEKSAIMKENLHTKYTPFTYNDVALNEKLPIMKQNLCIFFFVIGRVECMWGNSSHILFVPKTVFMPKSMFVPKTIYIYSLHSFEFLSL